MQSRNESTQVVEELDQRPAEAVWQDSACDAVDHDGRVFLGTLFSKYRRSLFRYLRGLVPSSDDAAELVQESYARLLRQSSVSRLEVVACRYLFQTATNLARDHYRRRVTHSADRHLDIDELPIADEARNPEQTLAWAQTVTSVKEGIKRLPPLTRRIFLLSRFRSKSYPEIAVMLGISTRTVERKMSEAMDLISKQIKEPL